jgi:hypothetical protein
LSSFLSFFPWFSIFSVLSLIFLGLRSFHLRFFRRCRVLFSSLVCLSWRPRVLAPRRLHAYFLFGNSPLIDLGFRVLRNGCTWGLALPGSASSIVDGLAPELIWRLGGVLIFVCAFGTRGDVLARSQRWIAGELGYLGTSTAGCGALLTRGV